MHRTRLTALAAVAAALLASAAPAAADAPWSDPAAFQGATDGFPVAAAALGGRGLAVWPASTNGSAAPPPTITGTLRLDGAFAAARPGPDLAPTAMATYGTDRVILAGYTRRDGRDTAAYAFGRGGGTFDPVRSFRLSGRASAVQALAAAPTGAAAMTVRTCETPRCGTNALFLVLRPAGRSFAKTVRIARGERLGGSAVAVNARGDALVAWVDARVVHARIRTAGGRLGPVQRLGRGVQPSLSARLGDRREALVAWCWQRVSEGYASTRFYANVAARPPGASYRSAFRAARQVGEVPVTGTGRYVAAPGVATALDAGRATVAYVTYVAGRYVVAVRDVADGRVGPEAVVSPPGRDAILGDFVSTSTGRQLVLSFTGRRGSDPSEPAVELWATPRGTAPERIASGEYLEVVRGAIDAESGRAFAAWRSIGGPVAFAVRAPDR